ncbi:Ail/Lom family outer membrane beta-barrel protein [Vibrio furnissii]|uniref:Ail/Lom family outer membrane beta-barrel protein n=1 Tax=Vibrio furnissii TaxID=29494 RepID=UPI0020C1A902|nr:Ail/Lom family outer membrane beta-barrel protein [Vibrio furnissii]
MKTKILALLILVSSSSVLAYEKESIRKNSIVVGFASGAIDISNEKYDDSYGVSAKYRYEINSDFGVVTSLTYTGLSNSYVGYYGGYYYSGTLDMDYLSILAGPTLRANKYFSVYGMIGFANGTIDTGFYSNDDTAFSYAAGFQINPTDSFVIDASYEVTEFSGDIEVGTWSVGAGYKF